MKSHGGFLRVESTPGRGTRFHVHLPAMPAAARGVGGQVAEMPRGNGELVLVIDDEEPVRQITSQTLEAFGYRVLVAVDGGDAVATYVQRWREIDVVITDMMMPVMDGPSTIQVLLRINPAARIIAASGVNANGMAAKATQSGVTHFLPKPYTADVLLKTLKEALTQP